MQLTIAQQVLCAAFLIAFPFACWLAWKHRNDNDDRF